VTDPASVEPKEKAMTAEANTSNEPTTEDAPAPDDELAGAFELAMKLHGGGVVYEDDEIVLWGM
jgi:hypothetical protein